jgi:hypothetical protein
MFRSFDILGTPLFPKRGHACDLYARWYRRVTIRLCEFVMRQQRWEFSWKPQRRMLTRHTGGRLFTSRKYNTRPNCPAEISSLNFARARARACTRTHPPFSEEQSREETRYAKRAHPPIPKRNFGVGSWNFASGCEPHTRILMWREARSVVKS